MAHIYVGQLPFKNFSQFDVSKMFEHYGLVTKVKYHPSKGEAFVTFEHTADADAAILSLHGKIAMQGRKQPLQVFYANSTLKWSWFGIQHNVTHHHRNSKSVALPTFIARTPPLSPTQWCDEESFPSSVTTAAVAPAPGQSIDAMETRAAEGPNKKNQLRVPVLQLPFTMRDFEAILMQSQALQPEPADARAAEMKTETTTMAPAVTRPGGPGQGEDLSRLAIASRQAQRHALKPPGYGATYSRPPSTYGLQSMADGGGESGSHLMMSTGTMLFPSHGTQIVMPPSQQQQQQKQQHILPHQVLPPAHGMPRSNRASAQMTTVGASAAAGPQPGVMRMQQPPQQQQKQQQHRDVSAAEPAEITPQRGASTEQRSSSSSASTSSRKRGRSSAMHETGADVSSATSHSAQHNPYLQPALGDDAEIGSGDLGGGLCNTTTRRIRVETGHRRSGHELTTSPDGGHGGGGSGGIVYSLPQQQQQQQRSSSSSPSSPQSLYPSAQSAPPRSGLAPHHHHHSFHIKSQGGSSSALRAAPLSPTHAIPQQQQQQQQQPQVPFARETLSPTISFSSSVGGVSNRGGGSSQHQQQHQQSLRQRQYIGQSRSSGTFTLASNSTTTTTMASLNTSPYVTAPQGSFRTGSGSFAPSLGSNAGGSGFGSAPALAPPSGSGVSFNNNNNNNSLQMMPAFVDVAPSASYSATSSTSPVVGSVQGDQSFVASPSSALYGVAPTTHGYGPPPPAQQIFQHPTLHFANEPYGSITQGQPRQHMVHTGNASPFVPPPPQQQQQQQSQQLQPPAERGTRSSASKSGSRSRH